MSKDPESPVDVPADGLKRLAQGKQGLFTSDLSVNEFLLVTDAGFEPVGLVIGSSIYHLGFQAPDLSGQDFWTLLRTGYRPVGLVMGCCVYHAGERGYVQTLTQSGKYGEMTRFTQALYDARELAMARMQGEAEQLQATGVVGVQIQENNHKWGSHTLEFFAVGTAVVPMPDAPHLPSPTAVLSLDT